MTDAFDLLERHMDTVSATPQHEEQVKTSVSHFLEFVFDRRSRASITEVDDTDMKHYYDVLNSDYVDRSAHNRWVHVRDYLDTCVVELEGANPALIAEKTHKSVTPADWADNDAPYKMRVEGESVVYIEDWEYEAMLEETEKSRNELLLRLLYDTGMRVSEVASLKVNQVNEEENAIEDVLTAKRDDGHERTLWYPRSTGVVMHQYLHEGGRSQYPPHDESDYLFVSQREESVHPNWLNRVVVDIAKDAGVQSVMYVDAKGHNRYRVTSHQFRHTFAINRIRSDVGDGSMSLDFLRESLGHQTAETTRWYLRYRDSARKEAEKRCRP